MKGNRGRDSIIATPLVRLLDRGRPEEACAAALVLGALRPKDPRVSRALARRLSAEPRAIRAYVLESLARQKTDRALGVLVEALFSNGVEREQARRLIVAFGARAFPRFDAALVARPDETGATLFVIAAGLRTRGAIDWLMGHLCEASVARARAITFAIRRRLDGYAPELRRRLRGRAVALLRPGRRRSMPALIAALRLLRVVHDPAVVGPLIDVLGVERGSMVRAYVLRVLRAIRIPLAVRAGLRTALYPLLSDPDALRVATPAAVMLGRTTSP